LAPAFDLEPSPARASCNNIPDTTRARPGCDEADSIATTRQRGQEGPPGSCAGSRGDRPDRGVWRRLSRQQPPPAAEVGRHKCSTADFCPLRVAANRRRHCTATSSRVRHAWRGQPHPTGRSTIRDPGRRGGHPATASHAGDVCSPSRQHLR
jgi:hypothetical protein